MSALYVYCEDEKSEAQRIYGMNKTWPLPCTSIKHIKGDRDINDL